MLWPDEEGVNALAFAPNGDFVLAAGHGNGVSAWDPVSGELQFEFTSHENAVWDVAITPDGGTAASGDHDGSIRIWDLGSGIPSRHSCIGIAF